MNPEYPIFSTTLCYLERDDAYLMLHRVKKEDDYNHDKCCLLYTSPSPRD